MIYPPVCTILFYAIQKEKSSVISIFYMGMSGALKLFNKGVSRFKNVHAEMRTRYERTIEELEKVFHGSNIFYGFYEKFFNPESYSRLAEFLNLELKKPDFNLRRNKSFLKRAIDPALAEEVAHYYVKTYRYIYDRFGPHVVELWSGYQYLEFPSMNE